MTRHTWKPELETYCPWCRRMVAGRWSADDLVVPAKHYRYHAWTGAPDPLNRHVKHTMECPGEDELSGPPGPISLGMEDPGAAFWPEQPETVAKAAPVAASHNPDPVTPAMTTTSSPSYRFWWWAR